MFKNIIYRLFASFRETKPIGRWRVEHLYHNNNNNKSMSIIDRKIDLANMDSCYCNKIQNCLIQDKKH